MTRKQTATSLTSVILVYFAHARTFSWSIFDLEMVDSRRPTLYRLNFTKYPPVLNKKIAGKTVLYYNHYIGPLGFICAIFLPGEVERGYLSSLSLLL